MRLLRTLTATALLALVTGSPAFAQRGGDRGSGPRPDGGGRQAQPRDSATVVDRMLDTGRRTDTGVPRLPGLGSASLIAPRPGVDAFRADPGTYDGRADRTIGPRGPSWGGMPVVPSAPSWGGAPVSSAPSWGGKPIFEPERGKRDHDRDGRVRRGSRDGSERRSRSIYNNGYAVLYGLPYGYVPYGVGQPGVIVQPASNAAAASEVPEGFLRLLITPREADVIVDGVVVGIVDDFGGRREQALPAGPHRVRIEAQGYEPVEFDVRVPAGDTISLRRELGRLPALPGPTEPATPERNAPSLPAARKTFYAIPNCYLGDSIPKAETLPKGCSLKDMRVLPPQ